MALQERLRPLLKVGGGPRAVRSVAAADLAYDPQRNRLYAAVLVYRYPEIELVESRLVVRPIRFPYVPGLLSFRELPAIMAAWNQLLTRPDLVLCDGQGIAHPRGIGLASHLGLLIATPTIGCAKSRLVGEHDEVGPRAGDRVPLLWQDRTVGAVLRTRDGVSPLYVSPGHLIGVQAAVRLVLRCCRGFRLPEPIRQADILVGKARRAGHCYFRHRLLESRDGTGRCVSSR